MNGLAEPTITEALITGAIWAGICIVFDVFGWVLVKHPWSLSFKEFYVDYQPWITLIYLAIFAGPYGWIFVYAYLRGYVMASSKEYIEFVLDQCDGLSARAMMGEYVLYYGGKVVGGVYDKSLAC